VKQEIGVAIPFEVGQVSTIAEREKEKGWSRVAIPFEVGQVSTEEAKEFIDDSTVSAMSQSLLK
jgi:hypothetical protein